MLACKDRTGVRAGMDRPRSLFGNGDVLARVRVLKDHPKAGIGVRRRGNEDRVFSHGGRFFALCGHAEPPRNALRIDDPEKRVALSDPL